MLKVLAIVMVRCRVADALECSISEARLVQWKTFDEPIMESVSPPQPVAASIEPLQPQVPMSVPSYLDTSAVPMAPAVAPMQNNNRVNVQFNDSEVAEMPMSVHHEPEQSGVLGDISTPSGNEGVGELNDGSTRTGPWLALTVLFVIGILILGIIYFVYRLIFGVPQQQGTLITQPLPTPTAIVTTVPAFVTPTPAVTVSANDRQRELDVADLRTAMASYFSDNGKYPSAASYNSLLNALISSRYLTRRVQDPLFPTQQYQYSASGDQSSYTITIQFEGLGSTLLSGSTTYQFGS